MLSAPVPGKRSAEYTSRNFPCNSFFEKNDRSGNLVSLTPLNTGFFAFFS
jgi:hypothetical protein